MSLPCEQERNIEAILANQTSLHESHKELSVALKDSMTQLREILLSEVANKKDIDQLKKENDLLFEKIRKVEMRTDLIEVRNAKCDGAGIFDNFPKIWNWYMQEQGWRRFVPAALTVVSALLALYMTISDIQNHNHPSSDARGTVSRDVGIP